jgi:signal transduction histidine kinase/CheY-like chemotaxis protein
MPLKSSDPAREETQPSNAHPTYLPLGLRGERDQLFLTYLAILALANAAFACTSWVVDYAQGLALHLAGLLLNLAVVVMRCRGTALPGLVLLTQSTLLAQALGLAWTSGGIFSPMLGWLAWASLPAVIDRSVRHAYAWIGSTALLILALYAYALTGGEVILGMAPSELVHWHVLVALLILAMQTGLLYRFQRLRVQRLMRMHHHARLFHRMRDDLVQTQKHKDIFVASVSHELRTPMNAILGLADLIHHDQRLPEDVRSKVENIQKSSEHLLTIINDLLDYSQISAGALRIVNEPFDLHETLRTAYMILEPRALTKAILYSRQQDANVPRWILGDAHRLTQVLVNLLGNAVKFTNEGFVSLNCHYEESLEDAQHGTLHIEVRDSGIGISTENQAKLFEKFVQADSSISHRFGGNGLGLSITRNLVEAMDGKIGVESESEQGSRFFISLPCQCTAPLKPRITTDLPLAELGPIRILVVDDNPLNRQVASLQIRRQLLQAEIDEATGGLQAFEKIRDGQYDVVLLDLMMPDMDGFETTRKVRSELPEPQRSVPIIALTANNDSREHERCITLGINESMVKPFDRVLLSKKIIEHAHRRA